MPLFVGLLAARLFGHWALGPGVNGYIIYPWLLMFGWIFGAVPIAGVIWKCVIASLFMWITPLVVLYGFNHNIFPAVPMAGVIWKFVIASLFMWITPLAVLYGFNHNIFPGTTQLPPESQTLVSGFLAVISINIVIGFYICMAMREPSERHVPDPAFLAEAKASISQSTTESDHSSQDRDKQE